MRNRNTKIKYKSADRCDIITNFAFIYHTADSLNVWTGFFLKTPGSPQTGFRRISSRGHPPRGWACLKAFPKKIRQSQPKWIPAFAENGKPPPWHISGAAASPCLDVPRRLMHFEPIPSAEIPVEPAFLPQLKTEIQI